MVTYLYRCSAHHETDLRAPMGQAPTSTDCACGRSTHRVFTAPMVRSLPRAQERVRDAARRSAEQPEIATAPAPVQPPLADPRHALLPRA